MVHYVTIGCIGVALGDWYTNKRLGIAMQLEFIRNNGHDYLTLDSRASASDALCPLPIPCPLPGSALIALRSVF